ncbi:MAG TPA: ABC transporter substrate-binding protein, partial [Aliarcobacter sp.]|nr:ABC transporter substrate-binding protein [Aliarcobacter sp.]
MKKIFIFILLFKYLCATDLQKVSLQLMWLDQFQFAGFYIAKEKGFYQKAGLDVEFKEFKNETNVLEEVTQNRATFGLGSSSL